MGIQPTGTVTFLFTDIVGSTAAWEADPHVMADALAVHDALLRRVIEEHDGYVFATGGDGYAIAFQRAGDAVAAAAAGQRGLRAADWPRGQRLAVRMGAHTGETVERNGDYFGPAVNRAARVMGAANGGQVVVSAVTSALVPDLGEGIVARPLGAHRFKGLDGTVDVTELVVDGVDDLGPLRSGGGDTHGLPDHRTSFVGRVQEREELRAAMAEHDMVTVVAPGGSGKTRLVTELGRELAADRRDGVWFVDLADVRSDDEVPAAVAAALDLGGPGVEGDPLDAVARWDAVIIMDNCEQVVDGAAEVADVMLAASGNLAVLATSREALAVDGERIVPLGPLGGEGEANEAVGLFLARARLVAPDLRPTAEDLAAIIELCDALDRLPLAVELAAARVDRMAIGDVAASLIEGRTDRRSRRRRGRHGDLRSVLAWSTDLLDDDERAVWRRLAVFEGGFTDDAAGHVAAGSEMAAGKVGEILDGLVDRSLVVRTRTPLGMRHRLLETVRAVALEELSAGEELSETCDRHAEWVESWSASVSAAPATGWLVDPSERDNQRRALRHLLEVGEAGRAAELMADAASPIVYSGHLEDADRLAADIRAAAPDHPVTATRLDEIDMIRAEWRGDFVKSHAIAETIRTADVDDSSWAIATALVTHHFAALDPPTARMMVAEYVDRLGEDPRAVFLSAEAAVGEARFADAVDEQLRGWGITTVNELPRPRPGAPVDVTVLSDLAVSLLLLGRGEEVEVVLQAMEDASMLPTLRHYVPMLRAGLAIETGDAVAALRDLGEAAALERRTSSPVLATDLCVTAAHIAFRLGRIDPAVLALAAVDKTGQRTVGAFGWRRWLREQLPDLDDDETAALRAQGRSMTPRDALATALRRLESA